MFRDNKKREAPRLPVFHHSAKSDDLNNRIRYRLDVVLVQRSHADAAGVQGVDAELVTQAMHLLSGQARVGEHAALTTDEVVARHSAGEYRVAMLPVGENVPDAGSYSSALLR